ncbi:heme ABC exporter ATP-binding protein CcmA [Solilutibacter silvestris]|uniref:CcmA: heme ABC exporter, ATP-binding protein CcmA n=1 Tax=Solilutibacter silvestris TaxID=1645665 RepID=A0A2K1PZL9_9GAMM|nr:heme ABC exporter ATP-binding protein CcmA [Lysobacter silvestris]PNS08229.1 ccmA: heme ABC exporter, ATP-binding protein CcmA [Lysobacter silvestris]
MPSHTPQPALLSVHGLGFSRNDEAIFSDLDFTVARGEALLVQGGNGVGKTTLLRVLAGLLPADSGSLRMDDDDLDHARRASAFAYLGHLPGHKGDLTCSENLEVACGLLGRKRDRGIDAALDHVGLAGYDDQLARHLSAGQKKRLSLARIWLSPAPLWLLDEPYANLDLDGIELVNRLIRTHLDDDGAALVTTHGAYAAPPVRTRRLLMERAA